MKGHQPLMFERIFTLKSTAPGAWTIEWNDGTFSHAVEGSSARDCMETALAAVQTDTIPTANPQGEPK